MNRTILIVICDFLLVSLLAFSTVDINKVSDESVQRQAQVQIATNQVDSGQDLAAVMRLALDEEKKNREQLLGELARSRESAGEREKRAQALQEQIQAREQDAQRLAEQKASLQQQYASAQTNIENLTHQLQSESSTRATESLMSKEKLAAMEAEAKKQSEQAKALQEQLTQLAQSNQMVLNEKMQLAGKLQVAEVEKRSATELASRMQEEVKTEREEKAKLAEGVKALASRSGELAQEVRDNRPLTPNSIFSEFVSNRVQASFYAVRNGLFGFNKKTDTETVLISNGTNTYALCHVQDTPLTLWNSPDWDGLSGALTHKTATSPIRELSFLLRDPRVVVIPIQSKDVQSFGAKVYRVSTDPYKFQDAVLVGAREGYYGECKFQLDLTTPDYLKLDHSLLKGLFGKFNPSRGDLVFSKTGELMGIMANDTYCLKLNNMTVAATFQFGADVRSQKTAQILGGLYSMVTEMPAKLQ